MAGLVSPKHGISVRVGALPHLTNQDLVQKLVSNETLRTSRIIDAFKSIDRKDFVLPGDLASACEDRPLSIGYGATISQPTTVAIMLEKLKPAPGDRILEIGTGSGYMTALLAEIAGDRGKVFSIEYVSELKGLAEFNLKKYGFRDTALFVGDGKAGLKDYGPFDKIISSASGDEIPENWRAQLKTGGRIVAPVGDSLVVLEKASRRKFKEERMEGFLFVPLK